MYIYIYEKICLRLILQGANNLGSFPIPTRGCSYRPNLGLGAPKPSDIHMEKMSSRHIYKYMYIYTYPYIHGRILWMLV